MTRLTTDFDKLVSEALAHSFSGWDFGYVAGRMVEHAPSWDYRQRVLTKMAGVESLLDLDTGGGEFLSSLQPLPPHTTATEGYAPNVPVARAKLEPLGVRVVATHGNAALPFEANEFELIINRHGSFEAKELHRLLKPGGWFVTQQVGGQNYAGLNEALGDTAGYTYKDWTLAAAREGLAAAGFDIVEAREEFPLVEFFDVGAMVYYLKVVAWQVRDFSVETYRARLKAIHAEIEARGKFEVKAHRFLVAARKPATANS